MSTFTCHACHRSFVWKESLAGRRLRCRCGSPITCPATTEPTAVITAPPTAPPTVLAYRPAPPADQSTFDPESFKNLNLPLALLGGSVAINFLAEVFLNHHSAPTALRLLALQIGVGTTIMLAGLLLAARFRGIRLGRLPTAALKLAAVSVAPTAAVALLTPVLLIIPFIGPLLGLAVEFLLYFALLGALFDLDESDTWYCVSVIFVLNVACYFVLPTIA